MPDRNGIKTLRDIYPIYCANCGSAIEPTTYKDGELVASGQSYWLQGIRRTDLGSIYVHKACGTQPGKAISKPLTTYDAPNACLYCAKPCEGRFCSDRCAALHEGELRDRVPSEATLELIARLREMRDQQERETPTHGGGHRDGNGAARPVKFIAQAEKLPPFVPQNEVGVVFMFGNVIDRLGYRMAVIDGRYPDAVVVAPDNKTVRIEFEFVSSNFIAHRHDPDLCDLVVCWTRDKTLVLPTIALSQFYDAKSGRWDFAGLG